MTPLTSLTMVHGSSADHNSQADRPERSRNAKAQARHRAKRKAYIEQLEQTVTKLQHVLALSPDQVTALPPPVTRIRELEQENEILHRELHELRRQLELRNAQLRPDIFRRNEVTTSTDERRIDRDLKRRRMTDPTGLYMASNVSYPHTPPPPLSIPESHSQYSHNGSLNSPFGQSRTASSLLSPYGVGYTVPGTPSESSSASSPSFSASIPSNVLPHQQPSDYASSSPHSNPRPASSLSHNLLPSFSHTTGPYELVKMEDDYYSSNPMNHSNGYPTHSPFGANPSVVGQWHAYSTERT